MAATLEIKYFNTFWIKKMKSVVENTPSTPVAPFANVPSDYGSSSTKDWYIEESRIRGGYNNTSVDFGVKAYIDERDPLQQHRFNTLIYSGIFNSRTGINNTNQFSVGTDITRSLDPAQGSIQKLYAEDTNLIIFQEDKVSRALIDKDAIYSAEGGSLTTSGALVIGQIVAYAGEYGISQDPFSFAVYGYRKYFTDKKRGAVLRLSKDGITEISSYGMHDFFRDELSNPLTERIIGSWDIHNKNYVVSIQQERTNGNVAQADGNPPPTPIGTQSTLTLAVANTDIVVGMKIYKYIGGVNQLTGKFYGVVVSIIDSRNFICNIVRVIPVNENLIFWIEPFKTLSFDESVLGWTSFYTFEPNYMVSLNSRFYSFDQGIIYEHNKGFYGDFYGFKSDSNVTVVLNSNPSVVKNFKTVNYEGGLNWQLESFIASSGDQSLPIAPFTTTGLATLAQLETNLFALNFKRKENKFFANLQQKLTVNTTPQYGEVIYGEDISGVKGFFSTVKFKLINSDSANEEIKRELFSISSDIIESSY